MAPQPDVPPAIPRSRSLSAKPITAKGVAEKIWTPTFGLLIAVQFSFGTSFSTFFALPKYLIEQRAADPALVGNAHGVFALSGAAMIFILGPLLDRYGRRPILIAGLALGVLSYAPFGYIHDPIWLLLFRALHGVSFAAVFNAGSALAVDLAPIARRAEAIGYFGTAMLATNALGPALAEPVSEVYGWSAVFWGCSCCAAFGLALALLIRVPQSASVLRKSAPFRNSAQQTVNSALLGAYLGSLALGVGVGASKTFLPALLVGAKLDVAPYFIAYTSGALVQRTLFGWVPDRLGHAWVFRGQALHRLPGAVIALVLYAISLGLASIAWTTQIYWVAPLIGVAHGMTYPAVSALAVDLADPRALGRTTAWLTGLFNLGFALSTAGLAPMQPWLGYDGLLLLGALFLLLAAVVMPALVLRRALA